ncbi:sigma-70 family RNA polymerase sigma factor [Streptomyces sp. NPDC052693]|uniref:sigma-70 family RNA polymerase sigma factor n=1 Tax=Streptomyces sp. NPDC052693 TaxID=3155814 RepID=UPI003426EBA9
MSHVDSSWFDDYFASRYEQLVWRARRSYRVSADDAEDLVQQGLLELYKAGIAGAVDIHDVGALEACAWRRITYRCLTHYTKNPTSFHVADSTAILATLSAPPSTSSSPELAYEEQSAWKAVLELVTGLPVRQQQHVALVAHGFKPKERAELLGISEVAERVAWHRLRKRLRSLVETPSSRTGEETA